MVEQAEIPARLVSIEISNSARRRQRQQRPCQTKPISPLVAGTASVYDAKRTQFPGPVDRRLGQAQGQTNPISRTAGSKNAVRRTEQS